jgi:hypothetical protein
MAVTIKVLLRNDDMLVVEADAYAIVREFIEGQPDLSLTVRGEEVARVAAGEWLGVFFTDSAYVE